MIYLYKTMAASTTGTYVIRACIGNNLPAIGVIPLYPDMNSLCSGFVNSNNKSKTVNAINVHMTHGRFAYLDSVKWRAYINNTAGTKQTMACGKNG